ncbi:MAG: hypothetical protein AAF208_06750 [Cyanobacteria bacterium P01_A01_bin.45]
MAKSRDLARECSNELLHIYLWLFMSARKQVRISLQPQYQSEADAICEALGLRDYSQLFTFLLKTHGSKLIQLMEKV